MYGLFLKGLVLCFNDGYCFNGNDPTTVGHYFNNGPCNGLGSWNKLSLTTRAALCVSSQDINLNKLIVDGDDIYFVH